MTNQERAIEIAKKLKKEYPDPETELIYENEMQLSIAVALSAQTTDIKVNEVTSTLFKKYKTWEDFAGANLTTLQKDIKGVNFHLGKAERLIKASKVVLEEFNGKLPKTLDELIKIPGIARKSANVILNELWGITEGIVVDTHVTRLSARWDLSHAKTAVKIEQDLMKLFPKKYWGNLSGSIVLHGRYVCKARKPNCEECVLNKICPSAFKV